MSDCVDHNAFARTVLDGCPGELPASPSQSERNAWAVTVLDAPPECNHLSHGSTALALSYAVGTTLTIVKSSFLPVDCGYLGIGSLLFSTTNSGAVASVIGQTCLEYIVVIIAQPTNIISTAQRAMLAEMVPSPSSDSLGQLKSKYNALLALLQSIWPEVQ